MPQFVPHLASCGIPQAIVAQLWQVARVMCYKSSSVCATIFKLWHWHLKSCATIFFADTRISNVAATWVVCVAKLWQVQSFHTADFLQMPHLINCGIRLS